MTQRVRRLLLISTILFFVLATPSVLLYAWGYSFDWLNKKIVLTGGLYLKSVPKGGQTYLDGQAGKKTPTFIKRLVPGSYQLAIVKDGYHLWQKKLKIESKLVTEARNIFLVPKQPSLELVKEELPNDFSLADFLPVEEADIIFYIQKPSNILYKTDRAGSFNEQISLTPLPADHQYQIFNSANERIAVLNEEKQLFLLDSQSKNFELLAENIQGAQFSPDSKKLLYYSPTEICVYYLEDTFSQPNKQAGQEEQITRLSQGIIEAIWYPQTNEHIIFAVNQAVKIIELDDRDYRNTVDLFNWSASQIAYSNQDKKIYLVRGEKLLSTFLATE